MHLEANTRYWVYIWAGQNATTAELEETLATAETGEPGWTLGDTYLVRPVGTAYSNYTDSVTRHPLYMKVEGTTNPEVLVSSNDPTATEGTDETIDFVVSLSRATTGPVQVSYELLTCSSVQQPRKAPITRRRAEP